MSSLKDTISNKVVSPSIEASINYKSSALVLDADEKTNLCKIFYTDARNKQRHRENVKVKLRDKKDRWFPKPGDAVEVNVFGDDVIIIGESITDYATQVKPLQYTKNDVYVDGADSSVGNFIF